MTPQERKERVEGIERRRNSLCVFTECRDGKFYLVAYDAIAKLINEDIPFLLSEIERLEAEKEQARKEVLADIISQLNASVIYLKALPCEVNDAVRNQLENLIRVLEAARDGGK